MSGRRLVPSLPSPVPLGPSLPGLYQEDEFVQRLTEAFDEAIAPLFASLDNLAAYVDPDLAPDDFLEWLAGWVGMALDEAWPDERRRALAARAVPLYRRRGTIAGLAEHVELVTGVTPEIEESGGASWSTEPESPVPGVPDPHLTVRLRPSDPAEIDLAALEALVASAKPAHVPARVEVVPK